MLDTPAAREPGHITRLSIDAGCIGGAVFLAAVLGILTRPLDLLAMVWPANALLLGLLLRYPERATVGGWLGGAAGLMAADLAMGSSIPTTLGLASANLSGVVCAYWLIQRTPPQDRHLAGPESVLRLFAICAAAACVSGLVGAFLSPTLLGQGAGIRFALWFTNDLVSTFVLLPILLTAPLTLPAWADIQRALGPGRQALERSAPLAALVASIGAGLLLDGPTAVLMPLPALLWCALSYSLLTTSLLALLLCVWKLAAISVGLIGMSVSPELVRDVISLRLSVALLALGPMTVAGLRTARNALPTHGAGRQQPPSTPLSQLAFTTQGEIRLSRLARHREPVAVLMLGMDPPDDTLPLPVPVSDRDDAQTTAIEDRVLEAFASATASTLRMEDLFGKLDHGRFVVLIPHITQAGALGVADRLRISLEAAHDTATSSTLPLSASIGLAYLPEVTEEPLEHLMQAADGALLLARSRGNSRIVIAAL